MMRLLLLQIPGGFGSEIVSQAALQPAGGPAQLLWVNTYTNRASTQDPKPCLHAGCPTADCCAAGLNTSLPPPALMSGDVFNTTQFPDPASPITNELQRYIAIQQACHGLRGRMHARLFTPAQRACRPVA
jgi:hypothetical protein